MVSAISEINGYLIAFFRGQLLVSLINGTATAIGLVTVGLDFGLLIGLTLCLLGIIPYLGIVLCWIPAVIIASVQGGSWLVPATAALVNIARGALIDQDALAEALREHRLLGAGLDVTSPEPLDGDHALWREPRCLITSHSADTPEMTAPLLAGRITENVRAFLGESRFIGIVDPAAGY